MFDTANHHAWEAMKALFQIREDRERRAQGLPTLEEEIAQEAQRFAEYCDPQPGPMMIRFGT